MVKKFGRQGFKNTDLMLLLARTKPLDKIEKIDGLSVFLVDVKNSKGITSKPLWLR